MSAIQRHPNKLQGRTVLIVAGTSGIGKALASALLSRGAFVIFTSTRQSKIDACTKELLDLYPDLPKTVVRGYTLDLASSTVEENIRTLVDTLKKDGTATIDHFVYLAGDPLPTYNIEDITLESWGQASQVRTISCILCIKHLLPLIKNAGPASADFSASITLTGGSVSDKPMSGGWALLSMVAAALNGAARQLAVDLKPLRVNTVAPGVVDTDLWNGMGDDAKKEYLAKVASSRPTGRVGDVKDVAEAYMWLMCDGNTTGEVVRTNGGVLLV